MSEPVTFSSIANDIKLARIMSAPTQALGPQLVIIADFIDALMTHLGWPDDLWSTIKTPKEWFDSNKPFIGASLELKTRTSDTPIVVVLKFQFADGAIRMVSEDSKAFVVSLPLSKDGSEQDVEALNNAGKALLDAAKAAVVRGK